MKKLLNTNPAVLIAAVVAVIGVASAFGLAISQQQQSAIVAAIGAVLALGAGFVTRTQVYSPATHDQHVADAYQSPHPMAQLNGSEPTPAPIVAPVSVPADVPVDPTPPPVVTFTDVQVQEMHAALTRFDTPPTAPVA